MTNKKVTSNSIASLAAKVLHDNNASETAKKLAGSALSQVVKGNETGKEMETLASTVLTSNKYSEETKELAGSVLSQSDKNR
jgi:hydroxylamine reductase (hybrid-cluster protein)